jgi:hypothetical protein
MAYDVNFTGGVYVACGNIDGDLVADIITGAGPSGGPHVKVFRGVNLDVFDEFYAYEPNFIGGVTVATGNFTGDFIDEIITGPASIGGPHVKVFNGIGHTLLQQFFAYDANFTGGVFVAAGNIDNSNAIDEIITGPGFTGGPVVRAFRFGDSNLIQEFFAFNPTFTGGVRVAAFDFNSDAEDDYIVGAGPSGGPHLRLIDPNGLVVIQQWFPFSPSFRGGIFVGA